ncbi:DUF5908 family protein [Pedobacter psychroterrae]|uniref:DUF5908 family protein n=1 Tax=Pedobacter psychroterrae TaxID=2530453 RepID=UPI0013F16A29|nr:DUF5908 family protein [Pedobacter psychroterrae]
MPVEIKELVIRATIVPETVEEDDSDNASEEVGSMTDQAEIVRQCVREVIKIMENNRYR